MSIPINPVSPRVQYIATAGDTVFDVPFPFFTNADLAVYYTPLGNVANDASDILVYSANYTITGAGSATGGTIILNLPAANTGDLVTIVRSMLEQRLSLYLPGGLFTADQVNNDFSMDVMMSQQNQMQTQKLTPHYQFSAPVRVADVNLPLLPANSVWQMNSDRSAIVAVPLTGSGGNVPPAFEVIGSFSIGVAGASTVEFINFSPLIPAYKLIIIAARPATNNVNLLMRTSSNNGVSYDSGIGDYSWSYMFNRSGVAAPTGVASGSDSSITIAQNLSNDASEGSCYIELTFINPTAARMMQGPHWIGRQFSDTLNDNLIVTGNGTRLAPLITNGIQFLLSSGNFAAFGGKFVLYAMNQ